MAKTPVKLPNFEKAKATFSEYLGIDVGKVVNEEALNKIPIRLRPLVLAAATFAQAQGPAPVAKKTVTRKAVAKKSTEKKL
jgi:hypothetical protein